MWTKVSWKHEDITDRDFLRNREEYVSWFRVLRTPFHFCSNFGCTSSILVFVARRQARLSEKTLPKSSIYMCAAQVWTGQKYQNSNRRFPNFNFSMFDTEGYLFLVTHPLAITGVYASGPLTDAMPDPREAFAEELAEEVEDVPAVMQPSESVTMAAWCVCADFLMF